MEEYSFFTTEYNKPIINQKIKELCGNIQDLVEDAREKMQSALSNQQVKFFKAFKMTIEKMLEEFQILQIKFDEYIRYYENESQSVAIQNKLQFFRNECHLLHNICKDYKNENLKLKNKLNEFQSENYSQHMLLLKQQNDKVDFAKQINYLSQDSQQNFNAQNKTKNVQNKKMVQHQSFQPIQSTNVTNFSNQRTVFVYDSENQQQDQMNNNQLYKIWKNCIQDCTKLIEKKVGQGQVKFHQNDKFLLIFNFLQNNFVQQNIENLMFKDKCCNHQDCVFNRRIVDEKEKEEVQENQSFLNPKLFDILSETTPSKFYRKKYCHTSEKYSPQRKKIIMGERVKSLQKNK